MTSLFLQLSTRCSDFWIFMRMCTLVKELEMNAKEKSKKVRKGIGHLIL